MTINVEVGSMSFGHALAALKDGKRVARAGWNGKGMWLIHFDADEYSVEAYKMFDAERLGAFIAFRASCGSLVPWLASQTDMLAEDWKVVK